MSWLVRATSSDLPSATTRPLAARPQLLQSKIVCLCAQVYVRALNPLPCPMALALPFVMAVGPWAMAFGRALPSQTRLCLVIRGFAFVWEGGIRRGFA